MISVWSAWQAWGKTGDLTLFLIYIAALVVLYAGGLVCRWLVVRGFPPGNVAVDRRLDWLPLNADLFALGMGLAVAALSRAAGL